MDVTVMSHSEHILFDGLITTTLLAAAEPIGRPAVMPQYLEAALGEMAAPIPKMSVEDVFRALQTDA